MKGDFARYGKYKFGDKRLMGLAWSPSGTILTKPGLANFKPRAWRPGKRRQA